MSHDDTGGFSLTNSAESASSGEAGGVGRIAGDSRTMTGNDLGGRSLVQAQVQAGVQGVAGRRLPDRAGIRPLPHSIPVHGQASTFPVVEDGSELAVPTR